MMRLWIAVALLSASWMWGLEYYTGTNGWIWAALLLGGVLLSAEPPRRNPCRVNVLIAVALVLPTLWMLDWPYRVIPLGFVLGLVPFAVGHAPKQSIALGWGAARSSIVLLGQAIALHVYGMITARCHDLPPPIPTLVAMLARLLGADASADGTEVVVFSTSGPQRLGVTWELVFDPVTAALLAGALVLVSLWTWDNGSSSEALGFRQSFRRWFRAVQYVLLAVGVWTVVRLGLLVGLFLHREMRAAESLKLTVMNQFFSPWVLTVVSLGAVACLARWVRRESKELGPIAAQTPSGLDLRRRAIAALVCVALTGMATTLLTLDPIGSPRGGRVVFVERHSDWEPTDVPYDTKSFGEAASYTYNAIYRYCGQYFDVSRIADDEQIDTARLADCDVLVVKTPTEPYEANEVRDILRFVERGGGLLLIGEHTDYMLSSSCLNQIARPLGFKFRPDNLFAVDEPYVQHVLPERLPHPALRNVPIIRYANSCSIDPGWSWGRPAVCSTGLWGLRADYNMHNFFPEAYYHADMRYGAFIQLWETRHGKGRVLAFTDSTIFSSFSTFEPGKAEMMLDMLSWLNCRSALDSQPVRILLRLAGLGIFAALIWLGATRFPRSEGGWLVLLAGILLGYLGSTASIAAWQRGGLPQCRQPLLRVVIDRTVSRVPLSEGGFTPEPNGYGLLEQWIPRLGNYTVRADGPEVFSGDVLVVLAPTEPVTDDYRRKLVEWVERGGKLVVVDSPDSFGTTANSLLWPFGIAVYHATPAQGSLHLDGGDWPGIDVPLACQVEGGEPLLWVGDVPVGTKARYGQGTVTAIGCGTVMNNASMGGTWFTPPGPAARVVYDVVFELFQSVIEDRPMRAVEPVSPADVGKHDAGSEPNPTIRKEGESP